MKAALVVSSLLGACSAATQHYFRSGEPVTALLEDAEVVGLGCDPEVKSLSGYQHISGSRDLNYFYWFFEAREAPETAPLTVWLTGGPGCSSQLALLAENGPCGVSADGRSAVYNEYSWNARSNILWVDQPAGVGFSYGDMDDFDHNEEEVAEDLYHFINAFLAEHPAYGGRGVYVVGESYGGHYAPATAARIVRGMQEDAQNLAELRGLGVGNGLTQPEVQYAWFPTMAYNNSYGIQTVSESTYERMVEAVPRCTSLIHKCQTQTRYCAAAQTYCNAALLTPYQKTGLNTYNIKLPCEGSLCYDFSGVDAFLNAEETMEALHVAPEVRRWEDCNMKVNADFRDDWMKNFHGSVQQVLAAGADVLIYAGDLDYVCNWYGNKAWTLDLDWSGRDAFNAAEDKPYSVADRHVGDLRSHDNLYFLRVFEAGHMVPMDQPEVAQAMFNAFIAGDL